MPSVINLEAVACPLCGADQPREVFRQRVTAAGVTAEVAVVACGKCGLKYTSPRPTADCIGRFYADKYYDELEGPSAAKYSRVQPGAENVPQSATSDAPHRQSTNPNSQSENLSKRERLTRLALRLCWGYPPSRTVTESPSLIQRLRARLLARRLGRSRRHLFAVPWTGQGRLLDFGCGACGFLRLQRDRGWDVVGIDFSETAARRAQERFRLDVTVGTWPGEALANRTFDVITAWHALEHLPDPDGWVRQAASRLAPGGRMIVCVPDCESWSARIFGPDWFAWELPRHFSHFNTTLLTSLLTRHGLTIEAIATQSMSLRWRLSAQYRARATGSTMWRWLSRCSGIWSVAARIAGWCGAGEAVVIRARKVR